LKEIDPRTWRLAFLVRVYSSHSYLERDRSENVETGLSCRVYSSHSLETDLSEDVADTYVPFGNPGDVADIYIPFGNPEDVPHS
jgi:hypothetical protein